MVVGKVCLEKLDRTDRKGCAVTTGGETQPKYRQIAAELRSSIQSGEYRKGDRLPGENSLMEHYQVARMTARQALAVLLNEGIVVARKGSGVYVRDFQPIIREGIKRLSREQWGSGHSIWSADVEDRALSADPPNVYETEAPDHIVPALGLDGASRVWVRERRFVLDDNPVLLATSYLPADIVAGSRITERDTGEGGTYARLQELGYPPVHFVEDSRARMPEPDEITRLDLPSGTPVVDLVRTAYTTDGRVVEVNEMTADASAYIFRYEFDT